MFPTSVIERIGYYVYFLLDPRDQQVFYIGKGCNNRVFEHVSCAISNIQESDKIDRIREIQNSGLNVEHYILRHNLSEVSALEIEAVAIDCFGIKNLTNIQGGHNSIDFGVMRTDELIAVYSAPILETKIPILLININKLFNRGMSQHEVYEATRKSWVLGERRNKAQYAVATYRGLTREAYIINNWVSVENRWGFDGEPAPREISDALCYKSLSKLSKRGAANPIRYINC